MIDKWLNRVSEEIKKVETENHEVYIEFGLDRYMEKAKDFTIFIAGMVMAATGIAVALVFDGALLVWPILAGLVMMAYGLGVGEELRLARYRWTLRRRHEVN